MLEIMTALASDSVVKPAPQDQSGLLWRRAIEVRHQIIRLGETLMLNRGSNTINP